MGNFFVYVIDSIGNSILVDSIMGQTHFSNTDPWLTRFVNLDSFAGQVVSVILHNSNSLSIPSPRHDVAIDDIRIYNPNTTSIPKLVEINNPFTLYPNPNKGNFNLKVEKELVGKNYQIFDMKGSVVIQSRITSILSNIELKQVNKGVYFIKIEGVNKTEKMVVY